MRVVVGPAGTSVGKRIRIRCPVDVTVCVPSGFTTVSVVAPFELNCRASLVLTFVRVTAVPVPVVMVRTVLPLASKKSLSCWLPPTASTCRANPGQASPGLSLRWRSAAVALCAPSTSTVDVRAVIARNLLNFARVMAYLLGSSTAPRVPRERSSSGCQGSQARGAPSVIARRERHGEENCLGIAPRHSEHCPAHRQFASPTPPTPESILCIAADCQATIVIAPSLDETHDRFLAAQHACDSPDADEWVETYLPRSRGCCQSAALV